jgi:hypothetical protein
MSKPMASFVARHPSKLVCLASLICALAIPIEAQAQDLQSARAFMLKVYRDYAKPAWDPLGSEAPSIFEETLLALIREDQRRNPRQYVGTLDWDPLCSCQDSEGLKVLSLKVSRAGAARARADVVLSTSARLTLDLVAKRGGWRVSDVHTQQTPSLVALLNRANAGHARVR